MENEQLDRRLPNPLLKWNILYYGIYRWTWKIFRIGYKRNIELDDLYQPLKEHSSESLGEGFFKSWTHLLQTGKPNLILAVMRCFKVQVLINFIVTLFMECVIKLLQPILLGKIISYFTFEGKQQSRDSLYWYSFGFVGCSIITICLSHPCAMSIVHLSMKSRVGCCSLIYSKALRLSKTALGQTTVGQIVNLVSNDVGKFDISTVLMNYLIIAPLQAIIMAIFMCYEIGFSALVGIALLLSAIPFQVWLGKHIKKMRSKCTALTDNRLRLMNEFLLGIAVIKMYTWEIPFTKLMEKTRLNEMAKYKHIAYVRTVIMSFALFNSRFALFCSLITYVLLGNWLTAENVFVLTSFYVVLKQSLTVLFPQAITMLADLMVSIKRLQDFMLYKETDGTWLLNVPSSDETPTKDQDPSVEDDVKLPFLGAKDIKEITVKWNVEDSQNVSSTSEQTSSQTLNRTSSVHDIIKIKNLYVKWIESQDFILNNVSINIKRGSFVAIVGPVGSGKSSLFYTLLKEVPVNRGEVKISGSISYSSQEPWLFNSSVIRNILFDSNMDTQRYKNVIQRCSLEHDILAMPLGDQTIVGEKGMALSGGQKSRISLARAVYRDADIYFLDDPLSAVDNHVGKQIFNECFKELLNGKTRILITHQPQYLKEVDHIIMMKDGCVVAQGTYDDLQQNNPEFNDLLQAQLKNAEHVEDVVEVERNQSPQKVIRKVQPKMNKPIINEEQQKTGSVSGQVYRSYFLSSGSFILFLTVCGLFMLTQIFASSSDYWISEWVNVEEEINFRNFNFTFIKELNQFSFHNTSSGQMNPYENLDYSYWRNKYMITYAILIVMLVIFTLTRSLAFFIMTIRASINLHNKMFESISYATMRFFHTNPSGRVLNRFSKDMNAIDEIIPIIMIDVIQSFFQTVGILIVVVLINAWLIIPTALLFTIFIVGRYYYLHTSRSLKRLEAIVRTPIFNHLSSSLQGMTTIRAFGAQQSLIKEFNFHQDAHSSVWFMYLGTTRAFGLLLDFCCVIFIAIVTLSFVFINKEWQAGNVGLAITQAVGLTGMIQWSIRQSTELENFMTCVERVLEYHEVEQEKPIELLKDKQIQTDWPVGRLELKDVSLCYSPRGSVILKNISFVIEEQQKVGIIGRTGSGKSSIVNAIFRMAYVEGIIKIDGVDTNTLGLKKIRSSVSVIPQEPVLFSGTIRQNIDPFGKHSDETLFSALEKVELKSVILEDPKGLDRTVTEGGSNFSVGQKQLICLARAIVCGNKLLILDEATASIDPQTDALLQKTIRSHFRDSTVLTIAHRLETVIDSDKIIVMDSGKIVEFDHPFMLLQNEQGAFTQMLRNLKKEMQDNLISIAKRKYELNSAKNSTNEL